MTFNQLVKQGRQTTVKKSTAPALQYIKVLNDAVFEELDNLKAKND